jgi:ABC-2 type transport system ATP-binding protein
VSAVLKAVGLGRRYGRRRALQDCTLTIPGGRVVGLVGPNGAGKTTLMHLAVGVLAPDEGTIVVLGGAPGDRARLERIGFVGQDSPVYRRMSVAANLEMGAYLNPRWDNELAAERIERFRLDPGQRAGSLSGGQRAQLALTLAMAKRPELLVLDEPIASLDPLARREFLRSLMEFVAGEQNVGVIISSHLVTELERICDYVIVLVDSRVQVAGDLNDLMGSHHRLSGPRRDIRTLPADQEVIQSSQTDKQTKMIVRTTEPILDPVWTVTPVTLEDLVLAYMGRATEADRAPRAGPRLVR